MVEMIRPFGYYERGGFDGAALRIVLSDLVDQISRIRNVATVGDPDADQSQPVTEQQLLWRLRHETQMLKNRASSLHLLVVAMAELETFTHGRPSRND